MNYIIDILLWYILYDLQISAELGVGDNAAIGLGVVLGAIIIIVGASTVCVAYRYVFVYIATCMHLCSHVICNKLQL